MAANKRTLQQMGLVCIIVGLAVYATGGSWAGALGAVIAGVFMLYKASKLTA